ncbi:hypothetical protein D0860_03978 [Hortaea werneckii]|uniref:Uncharacterized protein n=1 Tax=Hortaea werneckii TaxID=91943 RepID=A0A3M7H9L3_HORWE|nr:hypothetical protein D0860_03978 [Hortaea werneckii]
MPHRLFELGADADTTINDSTLMHFAETSTMSQLVMKAGFTAFHIRNYSGETPLMQVAHMVDAETLITVASLEQAADFYAQDASGKTALHHLLRSHHVDKIYSCREIEKAWQLMQHRNVVSCLNTLLRHGAAASTSDHCVYACSESGCTALTFALHWLSSPALNVDEIDCGIVFDLLQAVRHQSDPEDVSKWPFAIKRYHAFEEQGLKHTCCFGRQLNLSWRLHPKAPASASAERIQAMANSHWKSSGNVCTDNDIISTLANLCFMYEQQSVAKSMSADTHRKREKQYSAPIRVHYAIDESNDGQDSESVFRIREVTMSRYKDWLRWCDRNFIKLDIGGGRRNYTEYGWHLVSMFEDKVDELRSGAEIWYTAPEEPAETL